MSADLKPVEVDPIGQPLEEIDPAHPRARAELVDSSGDADLAADGVVALAADLVAVGGPLADDRAPMLAEPQGSLVSTTPEAEVEGRQLVEPAVDASDLAFSESVGGDEGTARTSEVVPADVAARNLGDRAPENTIPHHLARIEERYSSTTASESSMPDRAAVDPNLRPSVPLEANVSAVAVTVDVPGSSTMIVQDDELVAIRLGELVSLLEDRFDHPLYVWMKSSAAASKFVTAETLAAAGIRTSYDAQRKQIVFSTTGE